MTRDMTQGNITGHMLSYAVPLVFGNLFQQLYHTVDSVVVGQFNGKEALAAIGAAGPVMNILIFLIVGISMGSSILMAEYFGAKDYESLRKEMATSLTAGFLLTAVLTVASVCGSGLFVRLTRTPAEIAPLAADYLRIVSAGLFFTFLYNILAAGLRAVGDSKAPLYVLIFTTVVNVVLDLLLVGVLGMGVCGAAIATVSAQAASALALLGCLFFRARFLWVPLSEMRIERKFLKKTIDYSSVSALQQTMLYLGRLLVQSGVNSLGVDAVAAFNAVSIADSYILAPGDSLAASMTTFAAQNKGGRNQRQNRKRPENHALHSGTLRLPGSCHRLYPEPLDSGNLSEAPGNVRPGLRPVLPAAHVLGIYSHRNHKYLPGVFQGDRKPEDHPLGHSDPDSHPGNRHLPASGRAGPAGCGCGNSHRLDLHGCVPIFLLPKMGNP